MTAVGAGVGHVVPGQVVLARGPLAVPPGTGAPAGYALLAADAVVPLPKGVGLGAAAELSLASAAALAAVDRIDPAPGDRVLVNGAEGGVGRRAVRLLAGRDAVVVAVCGAEHVGLLGELGARVVVDRAAGAVVTQVRAVCPEGVDGLIDLVGGALDDVPLEDVPLGAVRAGGRVVVTAGLPGADVLAAGGLSGALLCVLPVREVVGAVGSPGGRGADGGLAVHTVLPLGRAAEGFAVVVVGPVRGGDGGGAPGAVAVAVR